MHTFTNGKTACVPKNYVESTVEAGSESIAGIFCFQRYRYP